MTGLTTHILDLANGAPAAGVRIDAVRIEAGARVKIKEVITNSDGRCDAPIIEGAEFQPGLYELVFHIGAYFDRLQMNFPEPKFLDEVPVRFGVADASAHYHVPLLVSPYGYSTYRGS